jgi:transcriptional regulator NrdR family protein
MAIPVLCPACGHPDCRTTRTAHDRSTDVLQVETWRDHACTSCGAAFQSYSRTRVLAQSVRVPVQFSVEVTFSS